MNSCESISTLQTYDFAGEELDTVHRNVVILNEEWLTSKAIPYLETISDVAIRALAHLNEHSYLLSLDDRGWAAKEAAERGHLEILRALLQDGDISVDDRSLGVRLAAAGGYQAVIQELLANGEISECLRGWAVRRAAKEGYLGITQLLLANGPISETSRVSAIENSASPDIAQLLQNGAI